MPPLEEFIPYLNEDEIENYLHRLGFETIHAENYSTQEQITLFQEAEG